MKSLPERVKEFNKGRIPDLLLMKYKNMREDAFHFYRGSCHLFYEDLSASGFDIGKSPLAWICGDLHLENFGTYKADNRLIYFDINDFDESALAPAIWDISRLLTSIHTAAQTLHIDAADIADLCHHFMKIYCQTLQEGHARLVQEETSEGLVKDLFGHLAKRKRADFLDKRTVTKKGVRRLITDHKHAFEVSDNKKAEVENGFKQWARGKSDDNFYEVLDIAYRIAGTGSLGLERYILLIEGKGSPDKNYLLDLKIAKTSSLSPYLSVSQPAWKSEAERIVEIQKRMQAFPLALLSPLTLGGRNFVLKELQPSEDKVDLNDCAGKASRLRSFIKTTAALLAWAQLRSAGRQGSAITDALIEFAKEDHWQKKVTEYAAGYAEQVAEDYKSYSKAYDDGFFNN